MNKLSHLGKVARSISKGLLAILLLVNASHAKLTIASYNIRTFDSKNSTTDKVALKKIMLSMKADFITVEEIVNANSFKAFIKSQFPNYALHLSKCGGGGKQKIGFLYLKSKFKLKKAYEDSRISDPRQVVGKYGCGRLRPALVGVFTHLKTREEFVAIGLHLKAGGSPKNYSQRARQYDVLARLVDELRLADHQNIILMGDFNTTGFLAQDADFVNFKSMLSNMNLETSSKDIQCTSYWSGKNRQDNLEEPSVLDHVVYPRKLLGGTFKRVNLFAHCKASKCERKSSSELGVSYRKVSDHCPVTITYQ